MSKTFSCDFENCGLVFTKRSDLSKHVVEHQDPSKLFRCANCGFVTKYLRNLITHDNTHSDKRPYGCPDMARVVPSPDSPSGSAQPSASEMVPCQYRTNCTSALLKHRKRYHAYVTNPRSRRRARMTPEVDRRAKSSPSNSLPIPPPKTISSNSEASQSAKHTGSSPCAYQTIPSPPSSMVQPLDNKHSAAPDARRGEVVSSNNSFDPSVAFQNNNFTHLCDSALAFPTLMNGPATVLPQNSRYYVANNAIATNNAVIHTSPQPPNNVRPSIPGEVSTDSHPVASCVANSYDSQSAGSSSYAAFASSPVGLPFDNRLPSHPATLHGEASNSNAFTFAQESTDANTAVVSHYDYATRGFAALAFPLLPNGLAAVSHYGSESYYTISTDSALISPDPPHNATTLPWLETSITSKVEPTDSGSSASYTSNYGSSPPSSVAFPPSPVETPFDNNVCIDANSSLAQQHDSIDRGVAILAPSPIRVPETFIDSYSSSDANDIASFSDFETKIHEDEIFFRGTGHEGCLCPEMMISAGVEGWAGSLLNTQEEEEYYNYSLA